MALPAELEGLATSPVPADMPAGLEGLATPAAPALPAGDPAELEGLAVSSEAVPEEDEGRSLLSPLADIGRGIVAAVPSTVEAIVGLGATGVDLAFDTNTNRWVTETGQEVRDALGLNVDDSAAGRAAEEITSFAIGFIPVLGWLGRAGTAARTGQVVAGSGAFLRSAERTGQAAFQAAQRGRPLAQNILTTRAGLIGTTALGAGLVETMVSRDGRATMSDTFEFLPDVLETERYQEGLTGRENAQRDLRNRLRRGSEAALLSGAFDTLLVGAAQGTRAAMSTPVVGPAISRSIEATGNYISAGAQKVATVPGIRGATQLFQRYFSPTRGAPRALFEESDDAITFGDAAARQAIRQYVPVENAIAKTAREMRRANGGQLNMDRAGDDLFSYLLGATDALDRYALPSGKNLVKTAADDLQKLRTEYQFRLVRELSEELRRVDPNSIRAATLKSTLNTITNNAAAGNGYLSRQFRMYDPNEARKFYDKIDLSGPAFQGALDDVVRFNSGGNFARAADAPENVVEESRRLVYEMVGLKGADNIGPEAALKQLRASFREGRPGAAGMVAKDRPLLSIDESMLIGRKPIIEASPSLRAFLGEITDPKELFIKTINNMARTTAASRFYREMANPGNYVDLSPAVLQKIATGEKPMMVRVPTTSGVTGEQAGAMTTAFARPQVGRTPDGMIDVGRLMTQAEESLAQSGYVKLGEPNVGTVFGGEYGAMTGMYVPRELRDAMSAPLELNQHPVSELVAILSQMRGLSQKALIVPNVASRIRDIIGSFGFLAGNANVPRNMDPGALLQTMLGDLANLSDAGQRRMIRKLELSGTQGSNILISLIREFISEGRNLGLSGKTARAIKAIEDPSSLGGLNIYGQIMRFFEKFTEGTDNIFKAAAILSEESKLTEALAKAGIDAGAPSSAMDELMQVFIDTGLATRAGSQVLPELTPIEVMAAELVKNTMPNYRRIGRFVRGLDRIPLFGNFTSFASENIRNSVNTVQRAFQEMAFRVPRTSGLYTEIGETGVRALENSMRTMGAQRLASFIAVASTVPNAMVSAGMRSTGMTEQDMKDLQAGLAADYLQGHQLVPITADGKGRYQVVDLSYVAPYSFILDPARAGLQEYYRRGMLGQSDLEQLTGAAWSSLTSYTDPFASEAIIFERIRNVLPASGPLSLGVGRGGKTATGATLYRESDPLGDKIASGFYHIIESLMPAYSQLFLEERGGELRPGRLSRAMQGIEGPRGEQYDVFEEMARQLTGLTPLEINVARDFEFNGREYSELRSSARGAANNDIAAADRTPEEMLTGWNSYLDNLYRIQSNLHAEALAAIRLFDDPKEGRRSIFRQLTKGGRLSAAEANSIIDGVFYPRPVAEETIGEVMRQINEEGRPRVTKNLPVLDMNRMVRDRIGQPLRSTVEREPRAPATAPAVPAPPPGFVLEGLATPVEAAPTASVVAPMPAPAVPQTPQAPARTAPPPSALLGSDPVSQMRNAEIAQSLSGQ